MDELLAVSAQEEDLNRPLQNLDTLLIQARNILQVSYAEVQRLLPLRQQVTVTKCAEHFWFPSSFLNRNGNYFPLLLRQCADEVNRMRAGRIEILHRMQGAAG